MRRIYHFLLCWLWAGLGVAYAQQVTPKHIGFRSVLNQTVNDGAGVPYQVSHSFGQVIQTNSVPIAPGVSQNTAGFPFDARFFPEVFSRKVFGSKGYFPDFVRLEWRIRASADRITRFLIYRKQVGSSADSVLLRTLPGTEYSFQDNTAQLGEIYKYTIFAEGIADDLREPYINIVEETGFIFPFGSITGRIRFRNGSASEAVRVVAETNANIPAAAVDFNGTNAYLEVEHTEYTELRTGFTVQMWAKYEGTGAKSTLFSKGTEYELSYQPGTLSLKVGGSLLVVPFTHPVDTFFHVTAVYKPAPSGFLRVYAQVYDRPRNQEVDSASIAAGATPAFSSAPIRFGRSEAGEFWKGKLDEIRLWNRQITGRERLRDFPRYIGGTETGLIGYWRANEAIGNIVYDFSRTGNLYYEHHARMVNAAWTNTVPILTQLSFRGETNADGLYSIVGFPYQPSGTIYTFTPMYAQHTFDPNRRTLFVGPGNNVFNDMDFTNISAFRVTGTVEYKDTFFPVEGVQLLIDGQAVLRNGMPIVTDNLGRFEIDVPIGRHYLEVKKNLHGFEFNGRFPGVPDSLFDFQEPLSGIEFYDTTLVKVAGRVVGGPREAAKQLGFGLSKNNIGHASIFLTTEKGYDVTRTPVTLTNTERALNTEVRMATRNVEIKPDRETGEFVAYLLPERYRVTSAVAGQYTFGSEAHVTINLEQFIRTKNELLDTLKLVIRGTEIPGYPAYNTTDFDSVYEARGQQDSIYTIGMRRFVFDHRQDFIYRERPSINVVDDNYPDNPLFFGDEEYVYEPPGRPDRQQKIRLFNEIGGYAFRHPVFTQLQPYKFNISVFEYYFNINTNQGDEVPVSDGLVQISNPVAVNAVGWEEVRLDRQGKASYSFRPGFPNIATDPLRPENSFTFTMGITAFTGQNGSIRTIWREGNPFRAFVFGGRPVGNDFVTKGPNQIFTILRDPPGTDSFTTLEKGNSISISETWSSDNTFSQNANLTFKFGQTVKTFAGVGGGTITETEYANDLSVGFESSQTWASSGELVTNVTTTETWSTATGQPYVGSYGDLYIGRGTNIVYGISRVVQPVPSSQCTECGPVDFNGFRVGLDEALRFTPEFGTAFQYTQGFIMDQLIPNIQKARNSFLLFANPSDVNPIDRQMYVSLVPPNDPRYGLSNNDPIWEDRAASDPNAGNGPSYVIRRPAAWINQNKFDVDSVLMFNNEIKEWEDLIARNEEAKVKAVLEQNYSFDGGASFTRTVTRDTSETESSSFSFMISPSVSFSKGFEINKFGFNVQVGLSYQFNKSKGQGSTTTNSTSYSFTFADGSGARTEFGTYNDYYSIDVKNARDGYSPVFSTRAGVSSCPYEGEERTKFYQPGRHILNQAMVPLEAPQIEVEEAVVSDVPANTPAVFTLQLRNESGARQGIWYGLRLDDRSNPFSARLEMDGEPLTGNPREIFIPFGETVTKTLLVSKGRDDVNDYENLRIFFGSLCDDMNADLRKEVTISAYFAPGCTDIEMVNPVNNWVLNTNNRPESTLNIRLRGFDINNPLFKRVLLQYKPAGSAGWTTQMIFYNARTVTAAEYAEANEPKAWLEGGEILYPWNMAALPDRRYDIRAVTICEPGPGLTYETPTPIATGLKDTKRPRLFGAPQPADGVLSAGEEIMIQFDEEIEAGLLTPSNFSVQGVLNGYEVAHNTSIALDGQNDFIRIPDGLMIGGNRSFTLEWWQQWSSGIANRQILFSQATDDTDGLEIGFRQDGRLFVKFGGQNELIANGTYYDNLWRHFAVTYNAQSRRVSVYADDQVILDAAAVTGKFSGGGVSLMGKSLITNGNFFRGNIHEVRAWNRFLTVGTVYANMSKALKGSEIGLVGYWPMDEAFGLLALDKARFRHANIFGEWLVLPKGRSLAFNGQNSVLTINTGGTVAISEEMDFSVELWFKADGNQRNTTLFSSGKGDGTDLNAGSWEMSFNGNGQLMVQNSGQSVILDGPQDRFLDDNWHHVAVMVSRRGNLTVMVDGVVRKTVPGSSFGPFFGANMFLGARGFKIDNINVGFDQYFKGRIDELRLWNLARTQEQIQFYMTSKLQGDDMGLMGYYPMETFQLSQGLQLMTPSVTDQFQNRLGPNGGEARATGTQYSDITPNIRLNRPVSKVDFDWVVNKDRIIITPASAMANAIEKTMLEITLDRVEDLYENRIASPISWTAFIDRNQLKWEEDLLEIEKRLNEPLTFRMRIFNKGGTQERYTINNLPPWLTASPSSGVIAPLSAQVITFTVNEGLNTGTYQQDLFLAGNTGFDEKLVLNLRVFRDLPSDWVVDQNKYQYSMNVVGQIRVDGRISNDLYDELAVFSNDECRGRARLTYVPALDSYLLFMTIYSNRLSGEPLYFKIWDDSRGRVYEDVQPEMTFEQNRTVGLPRDPVIFTTGEAIMGELNLPSGWKWISFGLQSPALRNMNTLFARSPSRDNDIIKSLSAFAIYDSRNQWQGSLNATGLNNESMYMVNFNQAHLVRYAGAPVVTDAFPLTVRPGWNWISYLPVQNLTVDEALSRLNAIEGDLIKSQYQFAVYTEGAGWLGSLRFMAPGEGYMLFAGGTGPRTFTYPAFGLLGGGRRPGREDGKAGYDLSFLKTNRWEVQPHRYETSMSVIATIDGGTPQTTLAAFVGDEVRGLATPEKDERTGTLRYFLTIYGKPEERGLPVTFRADEGQEVLAINERLSFTANTLKGTLRQPELLTLPGGAQAQSNFEWVAYPNPFAGKVSIRFGVEGGQPQPVSVQVFNASGQLVRSIWQGTLAPGAHEYSWDGLSETGSRLPTGLYLINIRAGEQHRTLKVTKE